jgi:hypothetical protein
VRDTMTTYCRQRTTLLSIIMRIRAAHAAAMKISRIIRVIIGLSDFLENCLFERDLNLQLIFLRYVSYEDSLKEFATETTETETTMTSTTRILARVYSENNFDRQSNRHSFSGFHGDTTGRSNKLNRSFMFANNIS